MAQRRKSQPSTRAIHQPATTPRRRSAWIGSAVIFLTAASLVGLYRSEGGSGYPLDDTWIHIVFAQNLVDGSGFGANPNEAAPGATSPLWVLLLSAGFLFRISAEAWPWMLGVVSLTAAGLFGAAVCHRLLADRVSGTPGRVLACICGVGIVTCYPLVWCAAGGMEVPIFGALLLAAVWAFQRWPDGAWIRALPWGLLAGLAATARPEGLLMIGGLAVAEVASGSRRHWRRAITGIITAGAVTLPYTLFCLATTGRWFPNTYYAKTRTTAAHLPDWDYLVDVIGLMWQTAPVATALIPLALAGAVVSWRRDRNLAPAALAAFTIVLPLAYASMDRSFLFAGVAGNFGRYLYPVYPLVIVAGWAGLVRLAGLPKRPQVGPVVVAVAVLAVLISLGRTADRADLYAQSVDEINRMQVQMARVLDDELPDGALVAATDVGALACLTDLRVLDLLGLVSNDVLDALRPLETNDKPPRLRVAELLARRRPDALVVYAHWQKPIVAWLLPGLELIAEIRLPGNITCGGSHLVAFRIHWSRVPPLPERPPAP